MAKTKELFKIPAFGDWALRSRIGQREKRGRKRFRSAITRVVELFTAKKSLSQTNR